MGEIWVMAMIEMWNASDSDAEKSVFTPRHFGIILWQIICYSQAVRPKSKYSVQRLGSTSWFQNHSFVLCIKEAYN